jgi:hypothetical protein
VFTLVLLLFHGSPEFGVKAFFFKLRTYIHTYIHIHLWKYFLPSSPDAHNLYLWENNCKVENYFASATSTFVIMVAKELYSKKAKHPIMRCFGWHLGMFWVAFGDVLGCIWATWI